MAFFQKSARQTRALGAHRNFMGGVSYAIDNPLFRLRLAASSCFFGEPMYYHRDTSDPRPVRRAARTRLSDSQVAELRATLNAIDPQEWRSLSPAELIEQTIDQALDTDPEATLALAATLRNDAQMRTTPQVILVRAAHHARVRGTGLIRQYAPAIVTRADEPAVGLSYQLFRYGKPVPNALKRAWCAELARADDYALAKYRLEGKGVKTVDVVNLVHPKSPNVDRLARGILRTTDRTWESILSSNGSSAAVWQKALPLMGHMALLRNLRNLVQAGVEPSAFLPQLIQGAAKGRQLPFRYYSAYCAVKQLGATPGVKPVLRALEDCLRSSLGALPRLPGRVMALSDNSGSAQGTTTSAMGTLRVSTIGNLTGVLAAQAADDGYLGVFGDRLDILPITRRSSALEQLELAEHRARRIGQSTENGVWLFWDQAIRKREHWDSVFVFSDMQAGHGGLYGPNPRAYQDYRWGST
jgi:hypothetical protein